MRNRHARCAALTALILCSPVLAQTPAVDARADAVLKAMSRTLASAKVFSFASHATTDTFADDGQKVQTARSQRVTVRRPDGIASVVTGDDLNLRFVYDGKQVLLHNTDKPAYALTDLPATIDQALDALANDYGLAIPLADVVLSDPYKSLIEKVRSGRYVGTGYVDDTKCHHLAFRQDVVDWQVWVEQGDAAVPRKIVITYKDMPGSPQFTAYLSDWNLAATPEAGAFTITVPPGVPRVDLVKVPTSSVPAKE